MKLGMQRKLLGRTIENDGDLMYEIDYFV